MLSLMSINQSINHDINIFSRRVSFAESIGAEQSRLDFQRSNELGEMPIGDSAQLADLDAAELPGPQQVVDLVPADMEDLRYLLNCVRLQFASPPLRASRWMRPHLLSSSRRVIVCVFVYVCASAPYVQTRVEP
jgi:hypothetical protein